MAKRLQKPLSDVDKDAILREMLDGTLSNRKIAEKWGISESYLRKLFSAQAVRIKDTANQLVTAEQKMCALPPSAQLIVLDLAATLRAVSSNLAQAATTGSNNAMRLHAIAAMQLDKVDVENPAASVGELQVAATVTKMANEASDLAVKLVSVNKGEVFNPATEIQKPLALSSLYPDAE